MRVWVVEAGDYDECHVAGAYPSIEAVIVAHPFPERYAARAGVYWRPGGWQADPYDADIWWNGLNGSACVVAHAYEVQEGPAPP